MEKIKKNINLIESEIIQNENKKKLVNILNEYKSVYYKNLDSIKIKKNISLKEISEKKLLEENKLAKKNLFNFLKENSEDIKCKRCKKNYYNFVNKTEKDCFYHPGKKIGKFCKKCKNENNYNCCDLCYICEKGCQKTFHV